MSTVKMEAASRSETGKGPGRRLRMQGKIPAIIYGDDKEPVMTSIPQHDFEVMVRSEGMNVLIDLAVDGQPEAQTVVIRDIQRDPTTDHMIHADFVRIRRGQKMDFEIPVVASGAPIGVKDGGILETINHTVMMRCLPSAVPHELTVDVSGMNIRDSLHISDITPPEGVEFLADEDLTLFTIMSPKEMELEEPVEAEEVVEEEEDGEPEVITKKKEEGEEEEKGDKK